MMVHEGQWNSGKDKSKNKVNYKVKNPTLAKNRRTWGTCDRSGHPELLAAAVEESGD
jgi:hypothetical protein